MRMFFDENFSPHLVAGLRSMQNGRPSEDVQVTSIVEAFGRGVRDELWIPEVAKVQGIALTQDLNVHRSRAYWELCQQHGLRVFFFRPPKAGWNYWYIVQLVIKRWPELVQIARENHEPFGWVIDPLKNKLLSL